MTKLGLFVFVGILAAVLFVGFTRSPANKKFDAVVWATPDNATVVMDNFAYNPPILAILPGTNVTWINRYPIAHRVTSNGSSPNFTSPSLTTGNSFTWTFDKPGNYTYYCGCGIHPDMKGKIVVIKK